MNDFHRKMRFNPRFATFFKTEMHFYSSFGLPFSVHHHFFLILFAVVSLSHKNANNNKLCTEMIILMMTMTAIIMSACLTKALISAHCESVVDFPAVFFYSD